MRSNSTNARIEARSSYRVRSALPAFDRRATQEDVSTDGEAEISVRIRGGCAVGVRATIAPRAQQPSRAGPQQPAAPTRGGGPRRSGAQPPPMPEILKQYQPISAERLKNPPDGDWPMIRRTYDGWGYSPLSQIDTDNVDAARAGMGFFHRRGQRPRGSADRRQRRDVRVDARQPGARHQRAERARCCGATGVRCRLPSYCSIRPAAALRCTATRCISPPAKPCSSRWMQRPGEEVWTTTVADNASGYYMSLAPLVADGKVLIGTSGGELGIRGFVAAFDAETGKELWRTYMVPAPGEPGSETWPKGDEWKTGGASVWVTANYDPATNLSFWGTGNGGPWMGDRRPGDNLYVGSTVAIDVATGQIKGHMQYNPNESWDWDEVSPPILVDYQRGGRTIKGLINVARNGYPVFPRADRRQDQLRRRRRRTCGRTSSRIARPEDRPARCRSGQEAGHRQDGRFLPVVVGREELAADRLQSEDAHDLHSGQRESVRDVDRARGRVFAGPQLHGRDEHAVPVSRVASTSAKCRRGTSTPASACGRTRSPSRRTGDRF